MKRQPWILAGTALGLLMSGQSFAVPIAPHASAFNSASHLPLIRIQDEQAPAAEEAAPAPAPEAAPAQEAAPEAEAEQPRRKRREKAQEQQAEPEAQPAQQEEAAPQAEQPAAQGEEQPTRRQRRERAQQQEEQQSAPAENQGEQAAPAAEGEQQPQSRRERERQRRQQQEQEQATPEAAPAQPETPPASETAPAPNAEQPQAAPAPEGEQQPQSRRERERQRRQQQEQDQTAPNAAPAQAAPGTEAAPAAPTAEQPAPAPAPDASAPAQPPATSGEAAPAQPGAAPQPGQPAPAYGNAGAQPPVALPPGEAPASQDAVQRPAAGGQAAQPAAPVAPVAPAGPPPQNDAAAQPEAIIQQQIAPVTEERGERRREGRSPFDDPQRRERPQGADVLRQLGDRTIIQFNNQTIVESNEQPRLTRGARDVYYEDLPRDRVRETVVREDGTQVVTIRNRYGDVVRRSRITPDGREYVLSYVEEDDRERVRDWRDPGLDLPPLQLAIPQDEYILDARRIGSGEDPDQQYYEFLDQPPVERVERLYSVDEVKRSSRIRQKTRRIDLDTINFEFGSASVPENQVNKLEGVASAMEKLLQRNPAETFLIEGHTDAVGSDVANLALSDRRAESVADALTNVFGIPPENLTTQGYGEQYLKVNSQKPEAQNRRVAIRRITALVAPATASAK
ncbi:OmpA family protein [Mesorhizobium sp. RP14(2022)]|uniref:OmpA family protein n=1 Tax=Mesorhizobium liriopis TaxID=2953882 RepID=A0ABT1C544_9HYPH|nr:OmpA family protein [Mesorhizobium liriopis]MCO6049912.1 OmpA family protein [Mesorhizobium liriopis]